MFNRLTKRWLFSGPAALPERAPVSRRRLRQGPPLATGPQRCRVHDPRPVGRAAVRRGAGEGGGRRGLVRQDGPAVLRPLLRCGEAGGEVRGQRGQEDERGGRVPGGDE